MIIDITQELFSCKVFPGDPAPQRQVLGSMAKGDLCNLTAFSMCAHNGTHVDAPAHFIADGRTLDQLPPEVFVGDCYVARPPGEVTVQDMQDVLEKAAAQVRIPTKDCIRSLNLSTSAGIVLYMALASVEGLEVWS